MHSGDAREEGKVTVIISGGFDYGRFEADDCNFLGWLERNDV